MNLSLGVPEDLFRSTIFCILVEGDLGEGRVGGLGRGKAQEMQSIGIPNTIYYI